MDSDGLVAPCGHWITDTLNSSKTVITTQSRNWEAHHEQNILALFKQRKKLFKLFSHREMFNRGLL